MSKIQITFCKEYEREYYEMTVKNLMQNGFEQEEAIDFLKEIYKEMGEDNGQ